MRLSLRHRYGVPLLLFCLIAGASCTRDDPVAPGSGGLEPAAGFVLIPAGSFVMGSPDGEPGRTDIEVQHPVTLSRDFWLQATEVTNSQFLRAAQWALDNELADISFEALTVLRDRGGNTDFLYVFNETLPVGYDAGGDSLILRDVGYGLNPDHPATGMTWWGAAAYCDWLSLMEGRPAAYDHTTWTVDLTATGSYRLPTEAEWEYAARAGSATAFAGSQILNTACEDDSLSLQAWYCADAPDRPRAVARLWPNSWGLYDMHGNLWEFCNDWFASDYYSVGPALDPPGPTSGDLRIARGGAWGQSARRCRSAMRGVHFPGMISTVEGLRPALIPTEQK